MSKYPADDPKKVENFTTPDENNVFTGKRPSSNFLPQIFKTDTNKRFLDTTVDQLLSSGSTETLDTYWGRVTGKDYIKTRDLFNAESRKQRQNYQLSPGISLKNGRVSEEAISYISSINNAKSVGSDIVDDDGLVAEPGYTLDLPINDDMFINYKNYYWLVNDIPPCVITPTQGDPIDIDDIVKLSHYTTPTLSSGKTLELLNGMRVVFAGDYATSTSGDYAIGRTYYVEGVGTDHIKFVLSVDENNAVQFLHIQPYTPKLPSEWDTEAFDSHPWDYHEHKSPMKEYVVMDRSSTDLNPWARANQWYSIYAIRNTVEYMDLDITDYTTSATRGQRPIIEFEPNIELFNMGTNYQTHVHHVIANIDPNTEFFGQSQYVNGDIGVQQGERILFLNCGNYSNKVFEVDFNNGILSLLTTQWSDPYQNNFKDKILVLNGGDTWMSGAELYWDGNVWSGGQQKVHRSDAPLYELYDIDGKSLFSYDGTDFIGDPIFSYIYNSFGIDDVELGFAPKINTQGLTNDPVFKLSLNTKRYLTDLSNESSRSISGMYFFKKLDTDTMHSGWSLIVEQQPLPFIKTYVASADNETVAIDIGSDDIEFTHDYAVKYEQHMRGYVFLPKTRLGYDIGGDRNPHLVWKADTDYTITQLHYDNNKFLEFVDPYGQTDPNITTTVNDNIVTVRIASGYTYSTVMYRMASDHTKNGRIFINNNNLQRISVKVNGDLTDDYTIVGTKVTLNNTVDNNDIVEVEWISNVELENFSNDVNPGQKYNPNNELLDEVNYSDMFIHVKDQFVHMPGFSGDIFGENNYHEIPRLSNRGGTIRQQIYSPTKFWYNMSDADTNPMNAILSIATDYDNFKGYFKTKVKQVWESYSDLTVYEITDKALGEINIGKNQNFKYIDSDMVYYNDFTEKTFVVNDNTVTFQIDDPQNLFDVTKNHVYVYVTEYRYGKYVTRQLDPNTGYTVNLDQVTLSYPIQLDPNNTPGSVMIRISGFQKSSWVPPSATKLGIFTQQQVQIVNGNLYGHDGSVHECANTNFYDTESPNFDVITACLLDLETRISAGLVDAHNKPNDLYGVLPSPHYAQPYTWQDTVFKLDDWYNRWAQQNDVVGFNSTAYYDANDPWTWNYSSVGPGIGGWKGLYTYFFKTTRPDTHPWEILNIRVKPVWWDNHYSWTDPVKRAAMIRAFKIGLVSEPTYAQDTVVPELAVTAYDWDTNTLVDTSETLQDPVAAGVVTTPQTVLASANFEFGDWGPYEDAWRQTSGYRFALLQLMLKLKPIRTHERFWELDPINEVRIAKYNCSVIVDRHTQVRTKIDNVVMHGKQYDERIISNIDIVTGGNGYNNTTKIDDVITNFGTSEFDLLVTGGKITSAIVKTNVIGYEDDLQLSITGPVGSGGAELIARTEQAVKREFGINNILSEWGSAYNLTSDKLSNIYRNLKPELMVHVSGYTDKNIINLIMDSSYRKGRVSVPKNDFSILLHKSAPVTSVFYSGVHITSSDRGYTVTGFNQNDRTFSYVPFSTGGAVVREEIGNFQITRYKNFKNSIEKISYGHTFLKRQELYNFLLGLAEYYERLGFRQTARWRQDANRVVEWSLDTDNSPIVVNGIHQTLIFEQGEIGYVDDLGYNYHGTANIIDDKFTQIKTSDLLVLRNQTTTEFGVKGPANNIHGLSVNVVEYEHIIAINNTTEFSDIIFDPVKGILHTRVKLEGERTRNWNGRVEAPGYLVRNGGIVTNLESTVRELERDNIATSSKTLNSDTRATARFNTGYIEPSYLTNTFIEDSAAYKFGKGTRKYQGTHTAINAMMRNFNLFNTHATHDINEDWMIALGDYGDESKRKPIELYIDPSAVKTNPQMVILHNEFVSDIDTDILIEEYTGSKNLVSGDLSQPFKMYPRQKANIKKIDDAKLFDNWLPTTVLPLRNESTHLIRTLDDMDSVYDIFADYATISNWSDNRSYKIGDKVRYDGKVYQLNVPSTGLTQAGQPLVLRGNVVYPSMPNGETLDLDGNIITFNKTTSTTSFNNIIVDGTTVLPSVPHNTTLTLDNILITFTKTNTSTVYNNIVVTGSVGNPTIVGNVGEALTIDGVFIDFQDTTTTTTNISALTSQTQALSGIIVNGASASAIAQARINALEALRIAYTAFAGLAGWGAFIANYHASGNNAGINVPFLIVEQGSADPSYATELDNLISADLDYVNALEGTVYVLGDTIDPLDVSAAEAKLDNGTYVNDFRDHLLTGASISTATIVRTITNTQPRVWNSQAIVNHITTTLGNNGKSNITATLNSNGQVEIVKVPSVGDTSLTIAQGGSNLETGLAAGTYNATSFQVTSGANLDIDDVVNQINAANINNVTAYKFNNVLRLISSNGTFSIAVGTANTPLGLGIGQFTASTNVTTTPVDLQVYDIVQQINQAGITGISAANVNNNVVITSVNPTLTVVPTLGSSTIGIPTGTFTADTLTLNTFDLTQWTQIAEPCNLKIHVLEDRGNNNLQTIAQRNGYNMYQTFDFDNEIIEICAGNRVGDDALISTALPHNLTDGDYIIIINSTSVPSVDGIHQVTGVENATHFYIDKFIETKGSGGKLLSLLPTRFNTNQEVIQTLTNTKYYDSSTGNGWQPGMRAYVDQVFNGSTNTEIMAVYKAELGSTGMQFGLEREQTYKVDNSTLVNAVIYDANTQEKITTMEVYDPAKGIIPGIADRELDFKSITDGAVYNSTTDQTYQVNASSAWDEQYVGTTWWDLTNAIYWDYEEGDQIYKQETWGALVALASIDVYEWTKSPVIPTAYEEAVSKNTVVDGVTLTGIPYVGTGEFGEEVYYWTEQTEYNINSGSEETYYYFWVKNKTTVPYYLNRRYSTTQLAEIIQKPEDYSIDWVALSGEREFLISNLESYLNDSTVVQLNFKNQEMVDLHREFILLTEGDSSEIIPEWLHMGLRDSIATFDQSETETTYKVWDATTNYVQHEIVKGSNGKFYRALKNIGNTDPTTNNVAWTQVYDVTEKPGNLYTTQNVISYKTPKPVPDLSLHKFNRYGNQIRPRQSWIKDVVAARRVLVDKLNRQILDIALIGQPGWDTVLRQKIQSGEHTYDMEDYWNFIDWVKPGSSINGNTNTDRTVTYKSELGLVAPFNGETARVQNSEDDDGIIRESIYVYTNGSWDLQYKEKATIKFVDLLWNYQQLDYGWDNHPFDFKPWDTDPGTILMEILDTIRNHIYVGQYTPLYADMWFTMLNYIHSEQTNVDWAFKTTYIRGYVEYSLEKQNSLYQLEQWETLIDYIKDVKPFHTKLRDVYARRTADDDVTIKAEEQSRNMMITLRHGDHEEKDFVCGSLNGGSFTDVIYYRFSSRQFVENVVDIIYNSHEFITDPMCNDWGREHYPAYFDEAVEFRVYTNTSGSTVDANSRNFRLFLGDQREYEGTVICPATTLAADITHDATTIEVADATQLVNTDSNGNAILGVMWIGAEQITYTNINGNTLYNVTRGVGGTPQIAHTTGAVVYEGGDTVRIPLLPDLDNYQNQLRMAFNDFGKSITDNTSTSLEARFVYDNYCPPINGVEYVQNDH